MLALRRGHDRPLLAARRQGAIDLTVYRELVLDAVLSLAGHLGQPESTNPYSCEIRKGLHIHLPRQRNARTFANSVLRWRNFTVLTGGDFCATFPP